MKRMLLRLAALAGVIVLGVWTIAQAQRETTPRAEAADRSAAQESTATEEHSADASSKSPLAQLRFAEARGKTSPTTSAAAMPARSAPPARLPAVEGEPIAAEDDFPTANEMGLANDRYARPLPVAPPPAGGGKFDWSTNPYQGRDARSNPQAAPRQVPTEESPRELPLVRSRQNVENAIAPLEPAAEAEPLEPAAEQRREPAGEDRYGRQAETPAADRDGRAAETKDDPFSTSRRTAQPDPFSREAAPKREPAARNAPADPFAVEDEPAHLIPTHNSNERAAPRGRPPHLGPLPKGEGVRGGREELSRIAPTAGMTSISDVGGSGMPGEKALEGPQTPSLTIHKQSPAEMQVGKAAKFTIIVRNSGTFAAHQVEVHDEIPQGTRLVGTNPPARQPGEGRLVWLLHTLEPGAERKVEVEIVPVTEGEVGSVASVRFTADATARSVVTRPQLVSEVTAPPQVMIGADVPLKIKLSNPGTGVATGVVLRNAIAAGFQHPAGGELEYEVGDLAPGESRELDLVLKAVKPGKFANMLEAFGDGTLVAREVQTPIEVVAPDLEIIASGPDRRFLERKAVYTFSVSNPGTASAKHVELTARLPAGFKFVEADNAGRFDSKTRAVHWLLEELPPARSGTVTLTAMPIEAGTQELVVEAKSAGGLAAEDKKQIQVEGVAAVLFQVADVQDPIEVGGESAYEIRVVNQGSKAAANVRVAALVPEQFEITKVEGPASYQSSGQRVVFDPIGKLAPKADTTYRITVRGVRPGDARFRVQLLTAEMTTPVTKEESTRVFGDE